MTEDKAERLRAILAATGYHIGELRDLGFADTARILAIARLDLQLRLHRISDQELDALCEVLATANERTRGTNVIEFPTRACRKA